MRGLELKPVKRQGEGWTVRRRDTGVAGPGLGQPSVPWASR